MRSAARRRFVGSAVLGNRTTAHNLALALPFRRRVELLPVHREKDLDSARIGCSCAARTARFRCQYRSYQLVGPATARRGIRLLPPLSLARSKIAGLRSNHRGSQANSQRKVGANARSARRPGRYIGFPPGVNVWLDLEGIAPSVPSQDVIDYVMPGLRRLRLSDSCRGFMSAPMRFYPETSSFGG